MPPVNHVPPSSILTTEIVYVKSRFFRVQVSPTEKLGASADCAYTSDAAEHSSVIKKKEAILRGLVRVLARQTGSTSPISRMGTWYDVTSERRPQASWQFPSSERGGYD